MDTLLFTFMFILSTVCFFWVFVTKETDAKIILSLLSTILFYLTALAAFSIEYVLESGETYLSPSPTFAGVCVLFGTLSLIFGFTTVMSLFKKPRSEEV